MLTRKVYTWFWQRLNRASFSKKKKYICMTPPSQMMIFGLVCYIVMWSDKALYHWLYYENVYSLILGTYWCQFCSRRLSVVRIVYTYTFQVRFMYAFWLMSSQTRYDIWKIFVSVFLDPYTHVLSESKGANCLLDVTLFWLRKSSYIHCTFDWGC